MNSIIDFRSSCSPELFAACLDLFRKRHPDHGACIQSREDTVVCEKSIDLWKQTCIDIISAATCLNIPFTNQTPLGFFSVAARYTFGSMVCEQIYAPVRLCKVSVCRALEENKIAISCELEPLGARGFAFRHSLPSGLYPCESIGHVLRNTDFVKQRIVVRATVEESAWTDWTNHVPRFYTHVNGQTLLEMIKKYPDVFFIKPQP